MYSDERRSWLVFLAFLYFKAEKRNEYLLTEGINTRNFLRTWSLLAPVLYMHWKYVPDSEDVCFIESNYLASVADSVFIKLFGQDLFNACHEHILAYPKLSIRREDDTLVICDSDKKTLFKSGSFCLGLDGFDLEFYLHFKETLGIDFRNAEQFIVEKIAGTAIIFA
jgi:hypothetical protein